MSTLLTLFHETVPSMKPFMLMLKNVRVQKMHHDWA